MKFSIRVQYGLQALLELALNYSSEPVQIKDIAKAQKVPIRYLEQLLLILKRRGLVVSARGKNGGYNLAKHADAISVLEIIEAFEGPIALTSKKMKKTPVLFEAFNAIEENIKKDLNKLTLEDLVFKKRQKDRSYTYNI